MAGQGLSPIGSFLWCNVTIDVFVLLAYVCPEMTRTPPLFVIPTSSIQNAWNQGTAQATAMLQTLWPEIRVTLFWGILAMIVLKLIFGRIGSAIYDIFYFGILFLIITIFGIGILLSPAFDIIYALLYPVSYFLTGRVLKKIKG